MSEQINDIIKPAPSVRTTLRTLLWAVLVVSAVGNSLTSLGGGAILVHIALGIVSAASIAGLIADRLRSHS